MNKIGVYYAYWAKNWNEDVSEYIKKAAGIGFDILEISSVLIADLNKHALRDFKKSVEDVGIEATYCVGFPKQYDIASKDPEVRKNGIEYAIRTIKAVHETGGKVLSGILYSYWPWYPTDINKDKEEHIDHSICSLKEIMKAAEDYDVMCCMEAVNRYEQFMINTAREGVDFVQRVGSKNAKLLLDTFHMNIEEDSFYDAIITAGDYLGHFHIGECNRNVPGAGRIPWSEIIKALKHIGYSGRIVMEPFIKMDGEIGNDIRVWRDISNGKSDEDMNRNIKSSLAFIRSIMELIS